MSTTMTEELTHKKCVPCEGGVPKLSLEEAKSLLVGIPSWSLSKDAQHISRSWRVKDFLAGIRFFEQIAKLAEGEDHHPDLHLVGYRNVSVELSTHAIGGLSENDFILAAKIDQIPVEQ